MHSKYTAMTPELYDYLVKHGHNEDPVLGELITETEKLGGVALMQIAPEQGTFLSMLARSIGARSAIEIGTFTGYSAICLARGLVDDGRLICCDVSTEWTGIAKQFFVKAGVADRIDLRIAPALETLGELPNAMTFDVAFIDADKVSYRAYYEALLPRLRANGLIIFDNVLWSGQVADSNQQDESTTALRELNDLIAKDKRVQAVMLSIADGLTIVRRRAPGETS